MKTEPTVFLIGGAPGAGKSTLGRALACRLDATYLTVDDLVTAVQSVSTPETQPGLHLMWQTSHLTYFTDSPVEKLKADAIAQHQAAWPIIERLIKKYATLGSKLVMDGWHIWPQRVAALPYDNVWAGWIVAAPAVLEARERRNRGWTNGSTNPEQMLDNFLGRSLWFNEFIQQQAAERGMPILRQTGNVSAAALCDAVLKTLNK